MAFKWRRWNNILHRDIGYAAAALTIIYSISGIAVNHVHEWNPNYSKNIEERAIEPITTTVREEIIAEAKKKLDLTEQPKNVYRPDPETLQLFYENKTVSVDLPTGSVLIEETKKRPVLYEMNQLHINSPKKMWTFIADLFAVCLIFLSISGFFVLKGKNGFFGRGKWFGLAGLLLPVLYWLYHSYWG